MAATMLGPLLFDANGRIRTALPIPTAYNGGIGTVNGLLPFSGAAVSHYVNGVTIAADGRLAIVFATPAYHQNGLPFDGATGKLCVSEANPVRWSNGLPFAANGALSVTPRAAADESFSDGFSEGFA